LKYQHRNRGRRRGYSWIEGEGISTTSTENDSKKVGQRARVKAPRTERHVAGRVKENTARDHRNHQHKNGGKGKAQAKKKPNQRSSSEGAGQKKGKKNGVKGA